MGKILLQALALLLLLAPASGAAAETWRVVSWDSFTLVAVDPGAMVARGANASSLPVLQVRAYPGAETLETRLTEEELDCAGGRVRTRAQQIIQPGIAAAPWNEVQPWRDGGSELDRLLVSTVCERQWSYMPAVEATRTEATAAHGAAISKAGLAAPALAKWRPAWARFHSGRLPGEAHLNRILSVKDEYFMVAADGGHIVLQSTTTEKVGEGRYRFEEVQFGPHPKPNVAAVWSWREVDCRGARERNLEWAGFDRNLQIVFHDGLTTLLADPEPMSHPDVAYYVYCRPPGDPFAIPRVSSTLREALDGFDRFYAPAPLTLFGAGGPSPWREAYQQACGWGGCSSARWKPWLSGGILAILLWSGAASWLKRRRRVWTVVFALPGLRDTADDVAQSINGLVGGELQRRLRAKLAQTSRDASEAWPEDHGWEAAIAPAADGALPGVRLITSPELDGSTPDGRALEDRWRITLGMDMPRMSRARSRAMEAFRRLGSEVDTAVRDLGGEDIEWEVGGPAPAASPGR